MKRCWVELSGAGRVSKLGGSSKQKHKKQKIGKQDKQEAPPCRNTKKNKKIGKQEKQVNSWRVSKIAETSRQNDKQSKP